MNQLSVLGVQFSYDFVKVKSYCGMTSSGKGTQCARFLMG